MIGGPARNAGFNYRLKEPKSVMETYKTEASGPEFLSKQRAISLQKKLSVWDSMVLESDQ